MMILTLMSTSSMITTYRTWTTIRSRSPSNHQQPPAVLRTNRERSLRTSGRWTFHSWATCSRNIHSPAPSPRFTPRRVFHHREQQHMVTTLNIYKSNNITNNSYNNNNNNNNNNNSNHKPPPTTAHTNKPTHKQANKQTRKLTHKQAKH